MQTCVINTVINVCKHNKEEKLKSYIAKACVREIGVLGGILNEIYYNAYPKVFLVQTENYRRLNSDSLTMISSLRSFQAVTRVTVNTIYAVVTYM